MPTSPGRSGRSAAVNPATTHSGRERRWRRAPTLPTEEIRPRRVDGRRSLHAGAQWMFDPPYRQAYNQGVSELRWFGPRSLGHVESVCSASVKRPAEPGGSGTRFAMPRPGTTEARSTLGGSPAAMIRPRVARSQATISPCLVVLLLSLVVTVSQCAGTRPGDRRRVDARAVLHDHRADHPRHAHAHSGRHAPTCRPQRGGRSSEKTRSWSLCSCPAIRRREPANLVVPTISRSLISQELGGARLTVAYVPEPLTRLCRLARGRLRRNRDGAEGQPGPDHARGAPRRCRLARAGAIPGHAQDPRSRPLTRHARSRCRPPPGQNSRQVACTTCSPII